MNDTISIVINLDSRPGFMEDRSESSARVYTGTRSVDYFTDGILNKVKSFDGYDKEVTAFIDVHEPLPEVIERELLSMHRKGIIDNLVFNKHTVIYLGTQVYPKWNDLNYLNAMILSRGKYLVHFDNDMAAFTNDKSVISEWLGWLTTGKYDYISYPSRCSPRPVNDPDFDYNWASTRFFICERKTIDYTEILKCLRSDEYLYGKYGNRKRRIPWMEHILGLIAGPDKVFYPPMEPNRYALFSWGQYHSGIPGVC